MFRGFSSDYLYRELGLGVNRCRETVEGGPGLWGRGGVGRFPRSDHQSLLERGPAQTVLALALIHHLAISNNLPLARLADFFGAICHTLIIEFIPKEDSQVQRLLSSRKDVFPDYTRETFEQKFSGLFDIRESAAIPDSGRVLYRMTRRAAAG